MKLKILSGKKEYGKLIRKMFLQTLAILGAAAAIIILLRKVLHGKLALLITKSIGFIWNLSIEDATRAYQYSVRNNLDYIIIAGVAILFFIFLWILLSSFTRYFDQIVDGVDKLSHESEDEIDMCPELSFVETKLRDVRRKLQQRDAAVRQAEQRKNDLVVYLAHDVKTPLTSVLGYLSLLDENSDMPDEQKTKYIHIAKEKAERLEMLVNEFFEITRSSLQEEQLTRESINLCYMMVQVADELYPRLSERGQQINMSIPEEINICGDANKLARVFNNLLKNAIAYGEENSAIDIEAAAMSDRTIITIKNKGAIPNDKLNVVFEKFYRLDSARGSATGGAGLGLAIAKDIVDAHGGSISAASEDGYTIFSLQLPRHQS